MSSTSLDNNDELRGGAGESRASAHVPYHVPEKPLIVNAAEGEFAILAFSDLWHHRELLYFLTWRDIKVRYKQTAMGAAWAILQPLLIVLVFAVFFGMFVGVPTDGLPHLVFYYCGLLPWTFFANGVSISSMSLIGNANLINKVYFPRIFIPSATVAAGLVDLLVASLILLAMAVYYAFQPSWYMLLLPAYLLLTILLTFGLGLWVAALTVKYRDIRHALPFVLQLLMFLTPIIYPMSVVPEKWRGLLFINPLTGIIEGMRGALLRQHLSWQAAAATVLGILIILGCGLHTFRRVDRSMADVI